LEKTFLVLVLFGFITTMNTSQRIAVVTGGNKGIGLAICRSLLKVEGIRVILTARNEELGLKALNELHSSSVEFHKLDITDSQSIDHLAQYLKTKYNGLDILINNAGIVFQGPAFNESVARETLGTNYFGTLSVCEKLLPIIRDNGRIVNISSRQGRLSRFNDVLKQRFTDKKLTITDLSELMNSFIKAVADGTYQQKGWPQSTYCVSKVGCTTFTMCLARNIDPRRNILINCCCPGWVKTDMSGPNSDHTLTPDEGAITPVWLALLPPDSKIHSEFCFEKKILDWTML